ncbi:MAG: hypothetical protein KJZ80_18115 [Hyphomicrobiaceae bacterium]|nr:hypothetical protein [Hyphomicrobiaceae bacterium]
MIISVLLCLASVLILLLTLRRDRLSLGLPLAYTLALALQHVPGAIAHSAESGLLYGTEWVEVGIWLTAIGMMAFVAGVAVARRSIPAAPLRHIADRQDFAVFCIIGGWFFTFGLSFLAKIPSLGAAIEKGGAIWILGVLLALRSTVQRTEYVRTAAWLSALMVYPVVTLLLGGFLSYGSNVIIIACSGLMISSRKLSRVLLGLVLATVLGLSLFVNYFIARDEIRKVVWSNASWEARIDVVADAFSNAELLNLNDERHLLALHERLNQNLFVGLSAVRLEAGEVDYLNGRSVWEAILAVVPRALWPEKPVYAGSPGIVREMTGLELSETTSWGVGTIMESYINFGWPGLVLGMFFLGWLIGKLDRKAALAEARGQLDRTILFYLPGVALIQTIGSMVELASGSVAALVAAYGWRWAWGEFLRNRAARAAVSRVRRD